MAGWMDGHYGYGYRLGSGRFGAGRFAPGCGGGDYSTGNGRHQQMYDKLIAGTTGLAALRPYRRVLASANMLMRFSRSGLEMALPWAIKAAQIVVQYLGQNMRAVAQMFGRSKADRMIACYTTYLAALDRFDHRVLFRGCPLRFHNCLVDFVCYMARQVMVAMKISYNFGRAPGWLRNRRRGVFVGDPGMDMINSPNY